MDKSSIKKTKLSHIVQVPQIHDEALLCFAESDNRHIPFQIKRFYYIRDVDNGAVRGKHAHKKTKQMLFCLQGSVSLILDNGLDKEHILLNKPNEGLFLDAGMWHEMVDFKKNTLLLIVASDFYDESDYIRDYTNFIKFIKKA
ncbi:MAG: FdtA/QdtA family cupin domain-containing protein [Patescibacteria group bacterium]|jgi:dTDP-4-dehydrorhamnose 3,5-epimerase-like enzyme